MTNANPEFAKFIKRVEEITAKIESFEQVNDVKGLKDLIANFKLKTDDFYRKERKLNVGVVGQVKAGKSSFLNTLLFEGKEILPKASTPKTATLTKMEYSEENRIEIEYYTKEEWEVVKANAAVDCDEEIFISARELVSMVARTGLDVEKYFAKGKENIKFATYDDLVNHLNDYVGEDGKFTPIVKAVILHLNRPEFEGLSVVDTPGLNDPIPSRTLRTKQFMEVCDVVFFLSQSGSFLDKSDWTLLSSQLPQKGVKKLVLIASKYDSGIRDVLRFKDEDDEFGDDENTSDNIPGACKLLRKKLKKRAREKVEEFVKELQARESSQELIEVIKQCANPLLASAMVHNMTNKSAQDYSSEEKNVCSALKPFSKNIEADLKLLGNFDEVKTLYSGVSEEKEAILQEKARTFVPTAQEELKGLLLKFKEQANYRLTTLEGNDRDELLEKKKFVEAQVGNIKADVAKVFGDLYAKLEEERGEGIRQLRDAGKEYSSVKERIGTEYETRSYTSGWWLWKKTHHYTVEKKYSYTIAADAVENIQNYGLESCNQVERVFTEALNIKDVKRRLVSVVLGNFDAGSENYDASLFKLMVEKTVSAIEFPTFNIDVSRELEGITGTFHGELRSADQKNKLNLATAQAVTKILEAISNKLNIRVKEFKTELIDISKIIEESLIHNIADELDQLVAMCENKEVEIAKYKKYIETLEEALRSVK